MRLISITILTAISLLSLGATATVGYCWPGKISQSDSKLHQGFDGGRRGLRYHKLVFRFSNRSFGYQFKFLYSFKQMETRFTRLRSGSMMFEQKEETT